MAAGTLGPSGLRQGAVAPLSPILHVFRCCTGHRHRPARQEGSALAGGSFERRVAECLVGAGANCRNGCKADDDNESHHDGVLDSSWAIFRGQKS
jgi:hypothetical protein